ncbi:MAG: oligosaccharide flippase family protein [Chloroflexi bacterium]|nr:oligosaccharide flippase family protein [Chloroflexota bacterium]
MVADSDAPSHNSERRSLGRIVLRNTLATTLSGGVLKVLNFLYTVYTLRVLGEAGFGQYSAVLAFVGLFGVFFEIGLAQYVQRTIAQDPARTQALFWNLVVLRLILAIAGMAAITGLSLVLRHEPAMTFGVALFTGTFVLAAFLMPLITVLTANERLDLVSVMEVGAQLVTIVTGVLLLHSGAGFLGLLYVGFITMPLQIVMAVWAIRRYGYGPLHFRIEPASWRPFIRASLPFGVTSLALTFNFNADTVILNLFHSNAEIGWYNAAYGLVFSLVSVAGGFLTAITPSFSREHVSDPERVRSWTRASVRWMMLLALPAAMGVSLLASQAIQLLYGQAFAPSGPVLAVIGWDIPLLLFCAFCGNVTAAVGLEHPAARIYLFSAALNVVLNLLLIPMYGKMAAASITIVTDVVMAGQFFFLLANHMQLGQIRGYLLRVAGATGFMGGAVWLAVSLPLAVPIAIGVVVYGVLALAMRLVEPAQLAEIALKVRRRMGPA